MEEPVTFYNKNGKRLFGVVHVPEQVPIKTKRVGVNLLNPGIKYRVAPHRLNVKIARRLCQEGFYVLRFDPEGIGDSEGELPSGQNMPEIWGSIQRGRYVDDTKLANDFFIKNYSVKKLILIGNCGGAITAALSAQKDDRVDSLILIDLPILLSGTDYSFVDKIVENREAVDFLFKEYMKRIFKASSWKNLINGKTDKKALKRVIQMKYQKLFQRSSNIEKISDAELSGNNPRINKLIFEAFESLIEQGKKVLFICAGGDIGTESFNIFFKERYLLPTNKYSNFVDTCVIEKANHIYTLTKWQESLINKISEWILEKALLRYIFE